MTNSNCARCASALPPESKFCPNCGTAVPVVPEVASQTQPLEEVECRFRLHGYAEFSKETKPLRLKGQDIMIVVDGAQPLMIPPNPTNGLTLDPGEHVLLIYLRQWSGLKACSTTRRIRLRSGRNYVIELKMPLFGWNEFEVQLEEQVQAHGRR